MGIAGIRAIRQANDPTQKYQYSARPYTSDSQTDRYNYKKKHITFVIFLCLSKMEVSKAERTREAILTEAMVLFNQEGYHATPIRELAKRLDITQGAIYGKIKNKDELARESFRKAYILVGTKLWEYMNEGTTPKERLNRFADFYRNYVDDPVISGGCPMLNISVEADDHYTILKRRSTKSLR